MASKKVMMIAYQFPPMGGAGVQRSSKFAKYLPQFGWKPVVLTVHPTGLKDQTLSKELEDLEIIRTKPYDPTAWPGPFGLFGKVLTRKIFIPDGEWIWYRLNRKKVLKYVKEHNPDVIYTTSYPYSDHLMGAYIKKHFPDIPWVVDFRDEWCNNPYILDMKYPKYRTKKERKMEESVVTNCDAFITNTPFMLDNFIKDYPSLKDKSYVIPNGYDQPDFDGIIPRTEKADKLIMTYTGAMYGRRKPDMFLMALAKAFESGEVSPKDIKVNFVGSFTQAHMSKVKEIIGQEDVVTFVPYLPHKQSIEFLMQSDVLLLIMDSGPGAKNFYSGKIFEYINTGKTILGLVPVDGAAAQVIEETKTGVIVDNTDIDAIAQSIIDIYRRWQQDTLIVDTNWIEVKKYDRVVLTEKLSEVFNKCTSSEGGR